MDVDDAIRVIGGFGFAQKKVFIVIGLYQVIAACHILQMSFIGEDPGWSCHGSRTVIDASEKCHYYDIGNCSPEYNREFTSIVTEWDLICSKSSLPSFSQATVFIGQIIGMWAVGVLADAYGRHKTFYYSIVLLTLTGFAASLAPSFYWFAFFRVIAVAAASGGIPSYILLMEVVGVSQRSFAGLFFSTFFSVGFMVLAVMAYLVREWRHLSLAVLLLTLLYLATWKLIPESPRWFLVNGHEDKAKRVLEGMARDNGTKLPPCELKRPKSHSEEGSVSMMDLLRGRNIRHLTIILFWAWFANCFVYYGLSLNAGNLGSDRYVSFALSGVVEAPGIVASYFLVGRAGRRWTHGGLLSIGGAGCLGWSILYWADISPNIRMFLALIGKSAVAGSFAVIYLYTTELIPTQVRGLAMASSNLGARIGGVMSPLILILAQYGASLPMLFLGVTALSVGFVTLSLPETLNRPLPETLKDIDR